MRPMLAGKYEPDRVARMLPMFAQPKMDGIRAFVRDGIAYTRSLKPVRSAQVQSLVAHSRSILEGMDGEFICGDPTAKDCYQRTMSSVMSYDKPDNDLHFHVFDKWDEPERFERRLSIILRMEKLGFPAWASILECHRFTTMWEVQQYESHMIELGHEGIILRHPMAYYKYGRGTPSKGELIKVKDGRWIDTEAIVTAQREEMENANEATINALGHTERAGSKDNFIGKNSLGSVSVKGVFPSDDIVPEPVRGKEYECNVGSGFDAYQREVLWDEDLTGRIVKFKFFTGGIKDKPRFPIFLGFRDPDDMSPGEPEQLSLL